MPVIDAVEPLAGPSDAPYGEANQAGDPFASYGRERPLRRHIMSETPGLVATARETFGKGVAEDAA